MIEVQKTVTTSTETLKTLTATMIRLDASDQSKTQQLDSIDRKLDALIARPAPDIKAFARGG